MVFQGAQTGAIKLTIRIDGTSFFQCQITDSIYLERAESLITKHIVVAYLE